MARLRRDPWRRAQIAPVIPIERLRPPPAVPSPRPPTEAAAADVYQPRDYPTQPCDSCRAPIIWAVTVNDRPMPVDHAPVDAASGNVRLAWRGANTPPLAEVLGKPADKRGLDKLFRTHLQTCPFRNRHRRRPT